MIDGLSDTIKNIIMSMGTFAPLLASLLIIIESMVPILPLFVFITINFIFFGPFIGFLISWIFTCVGSLLSYYLIKKGFKKYDISIDNNPNVLKSCLYYVKKLSVSELAVIISIPFTPAFMINIAAGISKVKFSKYFKSILIGKIFMVYFWGYIGTSFVESIKNPFVLIKIFIMLLLAYILSRLVNVFFKSE